MCLNPEVLRSAAERQLRAWPSLVQGHLVCLNLLAKDVEFTLDGSGHNEALFDGFALPQSHSVTPSPPTRSCLYYNCPDDLRFADSLELSAFELLTFRPDRRSLHNLLENLGPKAVTLLDVSHTPANAEVCEGLWEACQRLRISLLVVARGNLATVAGAWLSKFDKADRIDCSPASEESSVSTSAAASVPCYGLEEERQLLKEAVVLPFLYPNLYRRMGLRPSARVLVHGISGSGKSTLIDSVLADFMPSRVSIVRVDVSGIFGKYLGSTERNLQRQFDAARLKLPAVLILDGLESIATAREDAADDDGTSWPRPQCVP
ncbi:26s protease regulatory subunit, putative [Perkinsus marinus ATCC 50983]|uniref:26s protease regulatory subunit, putative n=1 Tax=Perkinsus marinus (strain ATCC 50983 / TXsc) TaxID=423536 RepID=C5L8K7_PERM5|nr:26s protease regulatory subunit, putative [Perkinsus marinus ATCC 50983]EER06940.1 26s protease regulatory subunit, putative [Perkinsus marinus ATCC 50983]|eukprot:XP_002775124.1 26s protease regulatory subunit, putative [Perkinsus marinus ATCC 50983]